MVNGEKKPSLKKAGTVKLVDRPTKAASKKDAVVEPVASWLKVPDESTLPAEVQELFQEQRKNLGFVHPYFKGFSLKPKHLLLWNNYYSELMYGEGELSSKEREIIAVVSSAANHCESCVITHKAHLREVIKDPIFPDILADDPLEVDLTQRERSLVDFAIKINQNASELNQTDLEPLREAGLSDEAILEAAEIATQFSLSNRLTKAFGWKVGRNYDQLYR
jgi:uncharacterized peroxidase-related enzyme